MKLQRLCLVPPVHGVGGMVSFRHKLTAGLAKYGVEVCTDLNATPYQAVLVIGGTRDLAGLWRARRRGIPIIQRLDGMNWLHRRTSTGVRHYLKAEYGNVLLALIRSRLASVIVYQSQFSRQWWERVYGPTRVSNCVIYNGVDLDLYHPGGDETPPHDRWRLLLVEGSLRGGYELGLHTAVALAEGLQASLKSLPVAAPLARPVELVVVGQIQASDQAIWSERSQVEISWKGLVAWGDIPKLERAAHLLYAADLNAACPNSVIEALACGLPVISFDTGALPELVPASTGRVAAYGGNPWLLEPPDLKALITAAQEVLADQESLRSGARQHAQDKFGLDPMVKAYLETITIATR